MNEERPAPPPGVGRVEAKPRMEEYFRRGLLAVLLLVAFIAIVRAYMAIEDAIVTWFLDQYVPVAQAVFSLVVLALAVWLIRAYVLRRA